MFEATQQSQPLTPATSSYFVSLPATLLQKGPAKVWSWGTRRRQAGDSQDPLGRLSHILIHRPLEALG